MRAQRFSAGQRDRKMEEALLDQVPYDGRANWWARPAALDPARKEVHGDLGFYFHCGDLDAAYRYLWSKGVKVELPVVRNYGMRQLMVRDPDGYWLCFQHPVDGHDEVPGTSRSVALVSPAKLEE